MILFVVAIYGNWEVYQHVEDHISADSEAEINQATESNESKPATKIFYFNRNTFETTYEKPLEIIEMEQETLEFNQLHKYGYYDENGLWVPYEQDVDELSPYSRLYTSQYPYRESSFTPAFNEKRSQTAYSTENNIPMNSNTWDSGMDSLSIEVLPYSDNLKGPESSVSPVSVSTYKQSNSFYDGSFYNRQSTNGLNQPKPYTAYQASSASTNSRYAKAPASKPVVTKRGFFSTSKDRSSA